MLQRTAQKKNIKNINFEEIVSVGPRACSRSVCTNPLWSVRKVCYWKYNCQSKGHCSKKTCPRCHLKQHNSDIEIGRLQYLRDAYMHNSYLRERAGH